MKNTEIEKSGEVAMAETDELARRLFVAALSYQMGVTYQTAEKYEKNYAANGQQIGGVWNQLADVTRNVMAGVVDEILVEEQPVNGKAS